MENFIICTVCSCAKISNFSLAKNVSPFSQYFIKSYIKKILTGEKFLFNYFSLERDISPKIWLEIYG